MENQYDIFISYSRKDTAIADKICAALDKQGIRYFIDRQGIGGGMEFPDVLAKAIEESKMMLFIASNNSYESPYTNKEINFAFNWRPPKMILPYVIDRSTLPMKLRFIFSDINIRTIKEHPIDTILMQDLCQLLGHTYKSDEDIEQEKKKAEEELKKKMEREFNKRIDKEVERKLKEALSKMGGAVTEGKNASTVKEKTLGTGSAVATMPTNKKKDEDPERIGWVIIGSLIPFVALAAAIWYGIKMHTFWTAVEIFIFPSLIGFNICMALSKPKDNDRFYFYAFALMAGGIAAGIHGGIYLNSVPFGIMIGIGFFAGTVPLMIREA